MDGTAPLDPTPTPSALPATWMPPPPPPPPPSAAHNIFLGRFGLRAGWGIAIVVAAWLLLQIVASIFALAANGQLHQLILDRSYAASHPGTHVPKLIIKFAPIVPIVSDGIIFLGLLGLCWFFSRGERRPLAAYGIGKYRLADILPGAFWGLVMMSLLVFVLHAAHLLVFDSQALHGAASLAYGLKWLLAFLFVGFAEEYFFRGYIQFTLMRGVWGLAEKLSATNTRAVAFWIAATLLSIAFALAHTGNSGENLFGLVQVFLAGITFAYALWRTGSLWWGIGFHMTWDWAQSFLFGVADSGNVSVGRLFVTHPQGKSILSGGSAGPEGSIFASIALLVTIAVIHMLARPGIQPAVEQQPSV